MLSFDPPREEDDVFLEIHQRTTEYIADLHENENFDMKRPNPHWAMTQIIVKDVLQLFGYPGEVDSAVVDESYVGRRIENVSALFAHVNIAKCSMNNPGRGKASSVVHHTCGNAYLFEELMILEPEILLTQGANANELCGELVLGRPVYLDELPTTQTININAVPTLWMPMFHPARFTHKIRETWPVYRKAIQSWRDEFSMFDR